jgi:hypothetical protein
VDRGMFLVTLLVGSAVLALWVDARLGERSPQTLVKVLMHAAGALVIVRLMGTLAPQVISDNSLARTMLALFAIVLPGWMYAFLASLWALKLVRSAMPR